MPRHASYIGSYWIFRGPDYGTNYLYNLRHYSSLPQPVRRVFPRSPIQTRQQRHGVDEVSPARHLRAIVSNTMRLFLLPISTRRALIYCQRPNVSGVETKSWLEKGKVRVATLWASWEKKESGWQRKVVDYGNRALKRIPYEEWGLKSIPSMSTRRKEEELSGKEKVQVSFPSTLIPQAKVLGILKALSTERQGLHKKRMIWSIVGMPLVAPFALVPV
jgi:hypothetical protein